MEGAGRSGVGAGAGDAAGAGGAGGEAGTDDASGACGVSGVGGMSGAGASSEIGRSVTARSLHGGTSGSSAFRATDLRRSGLSGRGAGAGLRFGARSRSEYGR